MKDKASFKYYILKHLPIILAFIIPIIILFILYIGRGIFPFGDNMYLRSDMYHQYAPFVKEFQRNIQNGGSLFYTWNIGLGTDFLSTYSYYLASPANWLVALFPDNLIPEFMNIMLIIKAGLMSSTFAFFVIRKFRKNDFTSTAFGCFYAMSSYMAAFSWNVMWLDCLVLFPLIIMGLEALVKEGKVRMYVITLAVAVLSNYYIAIMICIFLVLYFIYLMICEGKFENGVEVLHRICQFILYSVIGGCIAAIVVLPALYTLFITASSNFSFPSRLTAYFSMLELISKALINTETAVFNGHFPNIYCTMAVFVLVPLFWISNRIAPKVRIGKTILAFFMLFSFMFNIPTYIWHGFHFPNSLPCRQSFLYIFLILVMGYEALVNIESFKYKEIVISAGASCLFIFILQKIYESEKFTVILSCLSVVFVLLYLLIAALLKQKKLPKLAIMILMVVISIAEIVINTNQTGYSTTSRNTYVSDNDYILNMLDSINDDSFYRVEKVTRRTKNDSTWLDYKGASVFSSTTVAGNSDLYEKLGMQGQTNSFSYYGHTPFTQAMLGVKYEIANDELSDPLKQQVTSSGGKYLYQNKYSLSLGYMVDEAVKDIDMTISDPLMLQNEFMYKMCGAQDVFVSLGSSSGEECRFTSPDDGRCLVYISDKIDEAKAEVYRDGSLLTSKTFTSLENPEIVDVGDVKHGDEIVITSGDNENITICPAIMDYEKYELAMQILEEQQLDITDFEDTYVKGNISVRKDGVLFTTIPADPGWKAYVDGKETEYMSFEDSFIVMDLTVGDHVLEFKYTPQGFVAGLIVSIIALMIFILTEIIRNNDKKKQKANMLPEDTVESDSFEKMEDSEEEKES